MILETIRAWWLPISTALMLAIGIGGWAIRKGLVSQADFQSRLREIEDSRKEGEDRIAEAIGALEKRTLQIETDLRHMPRAEEISEIKVMLATVSANTGAMRRELESVTSSVNLLTDIMLRKGAPQ